LLDYGYYFSLILLLRLLNASLNSQIYDPECLEIGPSPIPFLDPSTNNVMVENRQTPRSSRYRYTAELLTLSLFDLL